MSTADYSASFHGTADISAIVAPLPMETSLYDRLVREWNKSDGSKLGKQYASWDFTDGNARKCENPLLSRAAERIRDGYFEAFSQMAQIDAQRKPKAGIPGLLDKLKKIGRSARGISAPLPGSELARTLDEKENRLDELALQVQMKMIAHNAQSLEDLKKLDYGFTGEQRNSLLTGKEEAPDRFRGLTADSAYSMIGSIIGHSIDSFRKATGKDMTVPNFFNVEEFLSPERNMKRTLQQERRWEGSPVSYYEELLYYIDTDVTLQKKLPFKELISKKKNADNWVPGNIADGIIMDAIRIVAAKADEGGKDKKTLTSAQVFDRLQAAIGTVVEAATPESLQAYPDHGMAI